MIKKFNIDTEGVFLICSKVGLLNHFKNKEDISFNYDFPEGILPMVNEGILLAFVSESGEDVKGMICIDEPISAPEKGFNHAFKQSLYIHENDNLLFFSHGQFTQICDWHQGNVDAYTFGKVKKIEAINCSWYTVIVDIKIPKSGYIVEANLYFEKSDQQEVLGEVSELVRV